MHMNMLWAEGTDCQSFLDYYNIFLRLPKYSDIKPCHFEKKTQHFEKVKKNSASPIIEVFKDLGNNNERDDEMDIENNNWIYEKSTVE